MKDKKKIIIGVLCALVAVMAVGYAALAQQLNITGTASIDSTWKVEITNITERDVVGDATSKVTPSYTATTANFSVGLIQPTDSITYDIEVSNLGTLKAKVDSINVIMDENDAIIYTTSGVVEGDKLGVNEKATLSVTVSYNSEITSQPSVTAKDITVTINYVQDLGEDSGAQEPSVSYESYSIGDQVTFAGSNWYVIKNSTSEENYVTLMKETILTSSELGEYAANETITCTDSMVTNGSYGCTTKGETATTPNDSMPYYYSDTCHSANTYGYTSNDFSGCEGHNDYEGSKVREYLEGTYINTLGSDNLKEVDGYKIRLITINELQVNFGYSTEIREDYQYYYDYNYASTPNWINSDFGNLQRLKAYWTMSKIDDLEPDLEIGSVYVGAVNGDSGLLNYDRINDTYDGVRPVINLLKSSI